MYYLAGWPDKPPSRAGISIRDNLAASYACMGALAALHHREKSGVGRVVDSTIHESVLNVIEYPNSDYVVSGYTRERTRSVLPNVAPSNLYECADGSFLIAANQDTVFRRLCEAMQQPQRADEPNYSTHTARGDHQLIELTHGFRLGPLFDESIEFLLMIAGKSSAMVCISCPRRLEAEFAPKRLP